MTRWTIQAEHTPHGVVYDVMGRGSASRRRRQDCQNLREALSFVLRYGAPGDRVRVEEVDGYARTVNPWGSARRTAAMLAEVDG